MAIDVTYPKDERSPQSHKVIDVQHTDCCIVGGGPAGVVLALLLARQGIPVMLFEAHRDFDRDFRGSDRTWSNGGFAGSF